ncbi:MAG: hypothetical protein Fur0023_20580 [Bacteroidia bacterium]
MFLLHWVILYFQTIVISQTKSARFHSSRDLRTNLSFEYFFIDKFVQNNNSRNEHDGYKKENEKI